MEKLVDSLSQFSRREQTVIFITALAVILYVLWAALLAPLKHKRDALLLTTINTQQSLGRVQMMAHQLELLAQLSSQAALANENVNGLIDASLRENGMTLSSLSQGAGGEVRVRIDKASAEPLMPWLYDLESKYHLTIRELSITASNDPGVVSVNLRIIKP